MACKKKKFTEQQAKDILVKSYYKNRILGVKKRKEIRAYYCEEHDAWHLTSEPLNIYEKHVKMSIGEANGR